MNIATTFSSLLKSQIPNILQNNYAIMSYLSNKAYYSILGRPTNVIHNVQKTSQFLVPPSLCFLPERGLKYKGFVKRRCKDCYYVVRDERMYIMCKTHPRHKQAGFKKKEKYRWILSHATQSPVRPW